MKPAGRTASEESDGHNGGISRRELCWDGVSRADTTDLEGLQLRNHIASLAKGFQWTELLDILSENVRLVNASRPGGRSRYAPLHQAAHGGAPSEVVARLLELGAFRSVRDESGHRPVDIALSRSHVHLLGLLNPIQKHDIPGQVLCDIQRHFHKVIRGRVDELVQKQALRLPELEILLEFDRGNFWFPVPGIMGGFSFWLDADGPNAKLIAESWSRMVGGSGERHEITRDGSTLTEEGFV
jgi:hypothetical protein